MLTHIRDLYSEAKARLALEWKTFQKNRQNVLDTLEASKDPDYTRIHKSFPHVFDETIEKEAYDNMMSIQMQYLKERNDQRSEPYEFYKFTPEYEVPPHRQTAPGLLNLPLKYHKGNVVYDTPGSSSAYDRPVSEDKYESYYPGDTNEPLPLHPLLQYLITHKYPIYQQYVDKYGRPAGTTDATFRDFNKEQKPSAPLDPTRKDKVLKHIHRLLDTRPCLPIHFVDTQFDGRPASTGTGYHNRQSFRRRAHAKYSHPPGSETKQTSKKYFHNATYSYARTLIHKIKETGYPIASEITFSSTDNEILNFIDELNHFLNIYPTILFTRNHISDRNGTLKVRPVYAVDELFLFMESMLTFPFMVSCRKPSCCIMYGLETIRGSNCYLDRTAQMFKTFFTIDWSGFDQRVPRVLSDLYYAEFLPSLIIINHGYHPTYDYPEYPDLDEHKMYKRIDNLLYFLHLWFNNMTFLLADGHAFRRLFAGIPSGLFNTQVLDSFVNLYLIIDAMYEFGCTEDQIEEVLLFVMGDDNSGFTNWPITYLDRFIAFLETYGLNRYNMVLSKTKSVITDFRGHIETLGYKCNFGNPTRPIGKLVAQLCYPEHELKPKFMSARAIGIAYAAAGMDHRLHDFCHDVYHTFLPYSEPLTQENRHKALHYLPYPFNQSEDLHHLFDSFPSIYQVREVYSYYHSPLQYAPKWNYAHFIHGPDYVPPHSKTMEMYRVQYNIEPRCIPDLSTVYS
jgi:hypothetical protein